MINIFADVFAGEILYMEFSRKKWNVNISFKYKMNLSYFKWRCICGSFLENEWPENHNVWASRPMWVKDSKVNPWCWRCLISWSLPHVHTMGSSVSEAPVMALVTYCPDPTGSCIDGAHLPLFWVNLTFMQYVSVL